jgi:prephenate dehydrogenase
MSLQRVGIVGTGSIGGSIARRLTAAGTTVVCVDADAAAADAARSAGLTVVTDIAALTARSEIVVVATPVAALPAVLHQIGVAAAATGARPVVIDTGSSQHQVHAAAATTLTVAGVPWSGSHPMAGTEHRGFGASDPALFAGAAWALTPPEDGRPFDVDAFLAAASLIHACGGELVVTDVIAHDRAVAAVSHLPHLLAAVLATVAGSIDEGLALSLAAGSLRDMTRVASSSPDFVAALCAGNAAQLSPIAADAEAALASLRTAVETGDLETMQARFAAARAVRARLPAGGRGPSTRDVIVAADAEALRAQCRSGDRIIAVVRQDDHLVLTVRSGLATVPTTAG